MTVGRRVIYLCDWLPPDFGAVGQYTLGFARERAAEGWDVVLIGLASAGSSRDVETHGPGRLTIVRLQSRPYDRASFAARLLWTLLTNLRLVLAAARHLRGTAEIRFTGSPPFLLHFLVPLNLVWRRRLIYRITDFWPECLMAARRQVPIWLDLIWRLTCRLRRRVNQFEVLGNDQARRLGGIGIDRARILLRRDPSPVMITGREDPLPIPTELRDRIVLLYSGNWGVAHDVDTFVEGYIRHHQEGSGRVGLWLNAVGTGADEVEKRLRAAGAPISRTHPVPLDQLPSLLAAAHAHLITLKDEFVGYVLPSKVHACVASGKPILFIGGAQSDVHQLCTEGAAVSSYRRVCPGDPIAFAAALDGLNLHLHRQELVA